MKKIRNIHVFLLLTVIMMLVIFMSVDKGYIYGSMTDWVMQHTVLADYFRDLFYNTGDLTPNLALNIGAGQNAYYFTYNGLLNPLIMLSYLFPFIKMIDYIMIISILMVIISGFLIYKWLINNQIDKGIAIICSILFMLMGSFFHAHRHLMFIDYLPFLIMGLMGIDRYFKERKRLLYIVSVFLMIMTSYYYSVGGLLCMVIYGVYKYIKENKELNIKSFLKDGFTFLMPMFTGVLMSFILLVPTALALLSSRMQTYDGVSLSTLLTPNFNFDGLLYGNYGIGLTAITLISIIYMIINNKQEKRFLGITMFLIFMIPIITYLLNGMLYVRSKVLIPFSPLIILLTSFFITDLGNRKVKIKDILFVFLIIILMSYIFKYREFPFYLDLITITIGIIIYLLKKRKVYLYFPLIIIALIANIIINKTDNYVTTNLYHDIKNDEVKELIKEVQKTDSTFYRMTNLIKDTSLTVNKVYNPNYYQTSIYTSTSNSYYKALFDDIINNPIPYRNNMLTASSNNIIFQTLMGIKYIISEDNNIPIGYAYLNGNDKYAIYENNDVFSLGYSSSLLMSENMFDKLLYPYRNEALLKYIVVGNKTTSEYKSNVMEYDLTFDNILNKVDNNRYIIDVDNTKTINLKLKDPIIDRLLFIKFKLDKAPSCKDGDISITINNITNKLTCKEWLYFNNNYEFEYVISSPVTIDDLNIVFSKGHFEIGNVEAYTMDYDDVKMATMNVDKFIVNKNNTKGDVIEGNITVKEDGYFATTIPYDKGYKIFVNGEERPYEIVNKSFIGFPITKGEYIIRMVYKSPGYDMGVLGSALGVLLLVVMMRISHKEHTIERE